LSQAQPASGGQSIALDRVGQKVAERYSLLTHIVVALTLLQEAVPHLRANPGTEWFSWIELIAATALMVAAVRELKFRKAEGHETIAWTEIFAGCVLMVEAAIKWREGPRHYPLAIARAFAATFVIALGFSHARLKAAKALRIDDAGIRWRRSMLRGSSIDWSDLVSISIDDRTAAFNSRNGSGPSLRLWRLRNKREVANAILEAAASRGIPVTDSRSVK
jgi:hypothetical protein